MKDGIIKNDGTSRLIRSVADFKTKYPTYDAFVAALVAGTLPLDVLFNADGWSQQPDFLNKANLLADDTAALFSGLPENPVPDDVLRILSKAVLAIEGEFQTPDGKTVNLLKYVHGYYDGETQSGTRQITVDFYPLMALIVPQLEAIGSPPAILIRGGDSMISAYTGGTGYSYTSIKPSFGENYIKWDVDDVSHQLNERYRRYYYFILGE